MIKLPITEKVFARRTALSCNLAFRMTAVLSLGICACLALCNREIQAQNRIDLASPNPVPVRSRIVEHVEESKLVTLPGNHPYLANSKTDQGLLDSSTRMSKMILVLKRSPEQEAALAAFNERQYDPKSPDFHHWLHAEEFGRLYGPSDSDMATVTSWLQNHGFSIDEVGLGRTWIHFSGTAGQVQDAFHVEMHRYLVNGKNHIANDRDPQIPAALAPVVGGVASLHDFFGEHYSWFGDYVKRDPKTGKITRYNPELNGHQAAPEVLTKSYPGLETATKGTKAPSVLPIPFQAVQPDLTYTDGNDYIHEDLAPADFGIVYNINPVWNSGITGTGVTVAITATSDVTLSDVATYRKAFGLPATTVKVIETDPSTDPGISAPGENTEDLEMVSAAAPGATLDLVVSNRTATTTGYELSNEYIIDKEVAPIMTVSYGACELVIGTAGNANINTVLQQGATEGISIFIAAGDSGSATCESQNAAAPIGDTDGLEVSGYASTQWATAVGGTDFTWSYGSDPISTYWNATNTSTGATAKGYIPEIPWNTTCANPFLLNIFTNSDGTPEFANSEALCNGAYNSADYVGLVKLSAGGGGYSHCTTNNTTSSSTSLDPSSCSGGYAKPSWQSGTGVPKDGKRDVPDISMFASYGFGNNGFPAGVEIDSTAILVCITAAADGIYCSASDYTDPSQIIFQENGGTSAASPFSAGIMALILQKTGQTQGLAAPVFYEMAAKQSTSACNAMTVKASSSCYFQDVTEGSNTQNCATGGPNCVTNTSGDAIGLLSGYNAGIGYDQATGLGSMNVANIVNGWSSFTGAAAISVTPTSVTFPSTTVGTTSSTIETVTIKNTGTAAASISKLEITGTDASSYTVASTGSTACGATLNAGASCAAEISFKPAAAGTLTATFDVVDNVGTQTASITGTGAAAATLAITLSPTSLTFASTTVGSTTAAQVVTVKNTGNSTVTLTSETITGTNASSFIKSATTCGSTLAASASCTVSVEFKPAASGTLTASLSVADNATGSPQTVKLTGTGAASTTPTLTVSPTSIAFPATVTGATSDAQAVTLTNTGKVSVTLSSIALGGTNGSSFIELTNCGATLAAGANCAVYIAFKPASAAALTATLSVTDNATGSPQKVTLTGTGTTAPSVKLSTTSIAFPTTKSGTTSDSQTVTLTNSGTATLNLTSITLGGTNPTDFESLNTCAATLAPGASCSVYIAFKPASAAAFKATLSIADNGSSSPQTVALSGTGN